MFCCHAKIDLFLQMVYVGFRQIIGAAERIPLPRRRALRIVVLRLINSTADRVPKHTPYH